MSARKGMYVVKDQPCDGGVSPNQYVAKITSEIRLFFPPNTVSLDEALDVLDSAYDEVFRQTVTFFRERDGE